MVKIRKIEFYLLLILPNNIQKLISEYSELSFDDYEF